MSEPSYPNDGTRPADLSNASFDEFVRFWFDRTIDPRAMGPPRDPNFAWYRDIEIRCEPLHYAESFIRLFSAPEFLLDQHSRDQLEAGFWAMMSPMVDRGLDGLLWSEKLPLDVRERLLRSMFELFAKLFARDPLGTASYMWWENLLDRMNEDISSDAATVRQTAFTVLSKILDIDTRSCQEAALHGLNHLQDPRTEAVVKEWLGRHPALDQKLVAFAESCMIFLGP